MSTNAKNDDHNLASFLHEILLTPYLDGPIARIEAAVTKVGVLSVEERTEAKIAEYYREYRALIGTTGRTIPQYSDPAI